MAIRPATPSDHEGIWSIFRQVIASGDTYAYPASMTRAEALATWFPAGGHTFVAVDDGRIVGTYVLKANQPGLGSHVANAGYMVSPEAAGRGIGAAMCRHSMIYAREQGFSAMQFNFVVSTNQRAVELWQRHGFAIVGTVPKAFRHPSLGLVDIHVMHREL